MNRILISFLSCLVIFQNIWSAEEQPKSSALELPLKKSLKPPKQTPKPPMPPKQTPKLPMRPQSHPPVDKKWQNNKQEGQQKDSIQRGNGIPCKGSGQKICPKAPVKKYSQAPVKQARKRTKTIWVRKYRYPLIRQSSNCCSGSVNKTVERYISPKAVDVVEYSTRLKKNFYEQWKPPVYISPDNFVPETWVELNISPTGRILDFKIVTPSGSTAMDESVKKMLEQMKKVSPPPGNQNFCIQLAFKAK